MKPCVEKSFISHLPPDGTPISNKRLREALKWNEDVYLDVKQKLRDEGTIRVGRGYGGTVSRAETAPKAAPAAKTPAKKSFISQLPPDGTPISNKRLREALKWNEDEYLDVKRQLRDEGTIRVGRGYGGTVSRAETAPKAAPAAKTPVKKKERALYEPLKKGLQKWSTNNEGYPDDCIVEIIGAGGRKGGGVYSKPDLVLFAQRKYQYTPLKRIDVLTFEVKTADAYGIESVYETAGHSRFANKSYLVIQSPEQGFRDARIEKECIRFQVGLIIIHGPEDPDTWEFLYDPDRRDPDPDEVEEFIERQVSDSVKKKITLWVV